MEEPQLGIAFGGWVDRHFSPSIESYCDILLDRIVPVFDDAEGEQKGAAADFLHRASSWFGEDYDGAVDAAYEHAQEHTMQFLEMRAVFLATGVSGLFHLFEKQLYLHVNKELKIWLASPLNRWQDLEDMIPKFDRKWGQDATCQDLVNAFRDADLQELRLVANTVKHGNDGQSYRQLVKNDAVVVKAERVEDDWTAGPYSILGVAISVQVDDVKRYRDAILRFWKVDGTFCAARSAFK
jgi:hypothetical protein